MSYEVQTIHQDDHDIRLDRWFQRHYDHIGKGFIDKLARKGAIRLDGKRCKGNSRVVAGQELRIPQAVLNVEERPVSDVSSASAADIKQIKKAILYEDRFIVVVNKPAGLASQGGSGILRSLDVIMNGIAAENGYKAHLIHRLDKNTSGVMVIAKTPHIAARLSEEFKRRKIQKIYLALLKNCPRPYEGTIDLPLRKAGALGTQKMIADYEQGKHAVSLYQLLENAGSQFGLVAFFPLTGRTHQLRAHAALGLKCPIVGDKKYGGEEVFVDGLAKKLHLHAWQLHFRHPASGEKVSYIAPLAETMKRSIATLGMAKPNADLSADLRFFHEAMEK